MAEVITVSALNHYVKMLLDANDRLFDIALRGEIANFVQNARSGHCYFSLRDAAASVKAVMFRSDARRLGFRPEEGMKVVVRCRATLYERDGAFQTFFDFCERTAGLNKRMLESLISAGCFDGMGANRAQLLAVYEQAFDGATAARKVRELSLIHI